MKIWMSAIVLALVCGLVGSAEAKGAKEKGAGKSKAVKGEVVSVAADGSSITISSGGKKAAKTSTITTDSFTVVTLDGAPSKVSNLTKGEKVTITPSTGTATTIKATSGGKKGKKK